MAKKSTPKERRKLVPFHKISDQGKRNNPQSLRKVLHDITHEKYGKNLQRAATQLQGFIRRRHGRTLHANFSDEILFNLLTDRTHIKYYHLEAYARSLSIPITLLLLYSRLVANQEDETPHYSEAMIRGLEKILKEAAKSLKMNPENKNVFEIADLLRWATLYAEEIERSEQRTLFPPEGE